MPTANMSRTRAQLFTTRTRTARSRPAKREPRNSTPRRSAQSLKIEIFHSEVELCSALKRKEFFSSCERIFFFAGKRVFFLSLWGSVVKAAQESNFEAGHVCDCSESFIVMRLQWEVSYGPLTMYMGEDLCPLDSMYVLSGCWFVYQVLFEKKIIAGV